MIVCRPHAVRTPCLRLLLIALHTFKLHPSSVTPLRTPPTQPLLQCPDLTSCSCFLLLLPALRSSLLEAVITITMTDLTTGRPRASCGTQLSLTTYR